MHGFSKTSKVDRRTGLWATLLAATVVALSGSIAQAQVWRPLFLKIKAELEERVDLSVNPFDRESSLHLSNKGMRLYQLSDRAMLLEIMQERGAHPYINVQGVESGAFLLAGKANRSSVFQPSVEGFVFCDHEIKVHRTSFRGQAEINIIGRIPHISYAEIPSLQDWPSLERSYQMVAESVGGEISALSHNQCLVVEDQVARPAWTMFFEHQSLPYKAVVSGQKIHKIHQNYFHTTGLIRAFETNPYDNNLKDFSIDNLSGNSKLSSAAFFTAPSGRDPATNASHQFLYEVEDPRFDEASTFVHATLTHKWFADMGFSDGLNQAMRLRTHVVFNGDKNNALYTPESGQHPPRIDVGDGDGIWLQNLAKDADVISHEYGHHVVYRTLKEVRGESLVLHEGLADFFTFARTGDPCLGESICPMNSPLKCAVRGQCLRTADNSFRFGDANLPSEPHLRSQLISGMLWDLHKDETLPLSTLASTTFHALGFLIKDSGYHDFVLSMLLADREQNDGAYGCAIYDAAVARGLQSFITNFDCDTNLPDTLSGTQSPAFDATISRTSSSTSSDASIESNSSATRACGVIAHPSASGGQMQGWVVLLMVLWPMALLGLSKRAKATV